MIHTAIRDGYGLAQSIVSQPWSINDLDHTGQAPLHMACRRRRFDDFMCLINHGADINQLNSSGDSPLHLTALYGLVHFARVLLDAGANVDCLGAMGDTPLVCAVRRNNTDDGVSVAEYILQRGASVKARSTEGQSVLHVLCYVRKTAILTERYFTALMDAGAACVLESTDMPGCTPLYLALNQANVPLASLLLRAGARTDIVVRGSNILHNVAYFGTYEVLQCLNRAEISGLDTRSPGRQGMTPLGMFRYRTCDYPAKSPRVRIPSKEDVEAFDSLLRGVRDRMIMAECVELEQVIRTIGMQDIATARDMLQKVTDAKVAAKITWEAHTFRAIELDVRRGDLELAANSIREFIEASKARTKVSPFDEEIDPRLSNTSECVKTKTC